MIATVLVGVLLLLVVPSRQLMELERSTTAELHSMAAAFAVSAELAFEQQKLQSLGNLSQLIRSDERQLIAAVLIETEQGEEVLAEFPANANIISKLGSYPEDYISVSAPLLLDELEGRVVIVSTRDALLARMQLLSAPIYFAFLVIILIQLILYRMLSRNVVQPIVSASALADRLGTEDYGRSLTQIERADEIGILMASLRRLRTKLRLQRRQNHRLMNSLEEKVEQRTQELTKALDSKDKFLAAISHELRTPLHSIIASLDLLGTSDTLSAEQDQRYVRLARRGSVALMHLINELLDFQKLAQRDVELYPRREQLSELVAESLETAAILFEESNIRFVSTLDIPDETWVQVDGQRLSQVLFNLISNARKFTHEGSVDVSVRCIANHNDHIHVQFSISDTGIGMDEDTVQRIGEAFFQSAAGLNRKYSGTGLGISIVNKILTAMNSELAIESELGVGSTFGFELRLTRLRTQEDVSNPFVSTSLWREDGAEDLNLDAAEGTIYSVLYVEDSETNQQVMAALLERFPVTLTIAASALQGYEHIKNERFDVIFTDIQMPDYSGVDLNNWFKANPGMNDHTRIYACTANVTKEARDHYEALGFSGVLVKPLTLSDLQSFFAAFEHRSPA